MLVNHAYEVQSKHPENMVLAWLTRAAGHSHTPARPVRAWPIGDFPAFYSLLALAKPPDVEQGSLMDSCPFPYSPAVGTLSPAIVQKSMVPLDPTKEAAGSKAKAK